MYTGSIANLVEQSSQILFLVIPAQAGIQTTGSPRQRTRQAISTLHDGESSDEDPEMLPSWKAWNNRRLISQPRVRALDPCLHRDDTEEQG